MKVQLMYPDRDFDIDGPRPGQEKDLRQDLELDRLWSVMSHGDPFLRTVAEYGLLVGLTDPGEIRYRQGALADTLANPQIVITMYNLVFDALGEERKHWLYKSAFYRPGPDRLLGRSVALLSVFIDGLVKVRRLAEEHRGEFRSRAFTQLFDTLRDELDDTYVATVYEHLRRLRFTEGVHVSLRLEKGCGSTDYILRTPNRSGWTTHLRELAGGSRNTHTFRIPPRDEAGLDAVAVLNSRAIMEVAESVTRSCDHVTAFLRQLRAELGFYIGCRNLHTELTQRGEPTCMPDPLPLDRHHIDCRGIYDPCLALSISTPVVGNDLDADGVSLLVITGANQGGKSTLLRSLGVAQLMMQAGMFVSASTFRAGTRAGVFTHFKREEDDTMTHGKFDEELVRMSRLIDGMTPDAMLLCNESFASTNESEASAIARDIIDALGAAGVTIGYVTHNYDLASTLYDRGENTDVFLRAGRDKDGTRSFRLFTGPPLPTSFGEDIYRRVFGTDPVRAGTPAARTSARTTP